MARQRQVSRYGAFNMRVDGLDEMLQGVRLGEREIASVWRDILRGPFGVEFLQELKARASDSRRSGATVAAMQAKDHGREGVEIGIPASKTPHPASYRSGNGKPNASLYSVGIWLESGTRMHLIPTKVAPYSRMAFGGTVVSRVAHPGTKARKPMFRTLQLFKRDFETLFIRELERKLAPKMGLS